MNSHCVLRTWTHTHTHTHTRTGLFSVQPTTSSGRSLARQQQLICPLALFCRLVGSLVRHGHCDSHEHADAHNSIQSKPPIVSRPSPHFFHPHPPLFVPSSFPWCFLCRRSLALCFLPFSSPPSFTLPAGWETDWRWNGNPRGGRPLNERYSSIRCPVMMASNKSVYSRRIRNMNGWGRRSEGGATRGLHIFTGRRKGCVGILEIYIRHH